MDALEHPCHFRVIARVICARPAIELAAAAAEVRNDAAPADRTEMTHQRSRIMRRRAAFEAVEQYDQRRSTHSGRGRVEPVEIDKVSVGRVDTFAAKRDVVAPHQRRIDCLEMTAGQPRRRAIRARHRFNSCASLSTIVRSTLIRPYFLSSASTSVQGAISVLVRSTMSQTALSYSSHFLRFLQSSSVILKRLKGVFSRALNRCSCSVLLI